MHDPNHLINWDVIQVEPEGEFQIEPQEGHNAPKSSHRTGKGAMVALRSKGGYLGAGGCHVIGTSIFVQFCGTLRRY